ncbi:MAG: histidine kinase [Flavobacteriaceae bacterium]|nr:histidine kinase [Flavobacteriaceae bacterium]
MIKLLKNKGYTLPVIYHIIFWIVYFLFNFIRWGSYFDDYVYSLKSNLVEFPLHILIVYFNIYYLIPKFILSKKYISYFVYMALSLALIYVLRTGLNYYLVTENIWPEAEGVHMAFTFNHIVAVVLGEVYVIAFVSAIKLTIDWSYEKVKNERLKKAQLQSELNFLKTQIQPHFFFNTLNNLYALAMQQSDKTPEVILKLSEIMQYVLYDVKESAISLLKEINYIYTYLELEKLRYGETIKSNLTINGNIDSIAIPPLLFLPFIENCFKHGTKNNDNIIVDINFKKKKNSLVFKVHNNFKAGGNKVVKHGIGIENVKKRLQLLYNNKYKLKTEILKDNYYVCLKIPI